MFKEKCFSGLFAPVSFSLHSAASNFYLSGTVFHYFCKHQRLQEAGTANGRHRPFILFRLLLLNIFQYLYSLLNRFFSYGTVLYVISMHSLLCFIQLYRNSLVH